MNINTQPYRRKAQFYETDQMGIVHHSNYIRWFEEARVDFMEQVGFPYDEVERKGISFAVLSARCEYKSMVRFGDWVIIEMTVETLTNSRMTIGYTVKDAQTGALLCTGSTGHCFYHNGDGRPVALSKYMPEAYALFESMVAESSEPALRE